MKLPSQLIKKLSAFKYPALILALGLLLLLLPGKKSEKTPEQVTPAEVQPTAADSERDYCEQTARQLERILSKIENAGQVSVMLTLKTGRVTQYQSDYDSTTQSDAERSNTATQQKTVILSRGSAYNEAAVVKTEYPHFQGALIVSEGGDDPTVRYALVSAVSSLLGLGTDKITVVKSK